MGGKAHGPNVPIGSARTLSNRRSLKGVLDSRRFQEASLRPIEIAGVWGKAFFRAKNPGGNVEYIVKNETMRTYAPGAHVLAGSHAGMGGEVVYGGPPPGRQGGSRVRRPGQRGVTQGNQYAFYTDGSSVLHAWIYFDGTFISERASISAALFDYSPSGIIISDALSTVGSGSLILFSGQNDGAEVWNVTGGASYSYAVPAGWLMAGPPTYASGYLWWIEGDSPATAGHADTTHILRLRRAKCDLTDAQTIGATYTVNAYAYPAHAQNFHFDGDLGDVWQMVTPTSVIVYANIREYDSNHEAISYVNYRIRFLLASGYSSVEDVGTESIGNHGHGVPNSTGSTIFTRFDLAENALQADSVESGESALWGASTPSTFLSANVNASGLILQYYDGTNLYRGSAIDDPGTIVPIPVSAHPSLGEVYPDAMFYFGS